jgi:cytochrome P450
MFIGPELRIFMTDRDVARAVLTTHHDVFVKSGLMKGMLSVVMGNGLLLSDGAVWRRNRSLVNPSFHHARVRATAGIMATAAAEVITAWTASGAPGGGGGSGVLVDMSREMSAITLNIICRAAFGSDLGGGGDPAFMYRAVANMLQQMENAALSLAVFSPVPWDLLPRADNPRFRADKATVNGLLMALIARRRALRADLRSRGLSLPADQEIMLDHLLDAREEAGAMAAVGTVGMQGVNAGDSDVAAGGGVGGGGGGGGGGAAVKPSPAGGFTDQEVLNESMTFVLAGHETTSQALSWAIMLLARPENRAWRERAVAEVDAALGARRVPTYDDLSAMPLVQQIVWETMRMYPPIPLVRPWGTGGGGVGNGVAVGGSACGVAWRVFDPMPPVTADLLYCDSACRPPIPCLMSGRLRHSSCNRRPRGTTAHSGTRQHGAD